MQNQLHKIVVATGNVGKLKELSTLLGSLNLEVIGQKEYGITDVDETGLSFVENAIIKARHACQGTQLPAIADDSGLEVDALKGQPGIYSARYSGPAATDRSNIEKLLHELEGVESHLRTARFRCVLVVLRHAEDPSPLICEGTWEGFIADSISGQNGFGYDPIFYAPEFNCTSAELKPEQKNQISHRGKALQQFKSRMEKLGQIIV